jgi:hypothetical protein
VQNASIFFVKLIPKYFIFFDAIVIVEFFSNLLFKLVTVRLEHVIDFCILIWHIATLLNTIIISEGSFVDSLGFSMEQFYHPQIKVVSFHSF